MASRLPTSPRKIQSTLLPGHDEQALRRPSPEQPEERVDLGVGGPALRTRDHAAIIYWEPQELLASVVPYLRAGLEAGDKVVYVADDLDRAEVLAGVLVGDLEDRALG